MQGYWSGLPFPSPGDLPNQGIKPGSSALQADSLQTSYQGSPFNLSLKFTYLWGLHCSCAVEHCNCIQYSMVTEEFDLWGQDPGRRMGFTLVTSTTLSLLWSQG